MRCRDMNRLIMNYLVIEGYKDAAEHFAAETGVRPPGDLALIQDRMEIRRAIQNGRVVEAIEMVNELNPEVSAGQQRPPWLFDVTRLT